MIKSYHERQKRSPLAGNLGCGDGGAALAGGRGPLGMREGESRPIGRTPTFARARRGGPRGARRSGGADHSRHQPAGRHALPRFRAGPGALFSNGPEPPGRGGFWAKGVWVPVLLPRSIASREKAQLKKLVAEGLAQVAIGTHALLEK